MKFYVFLFIFIYAATQSVSALSENYLNLLPKTPTATQQQAASDLIARTVGAEWSRNFTATVDPRLPHRSYKISKCSAYTICIDGSDGVAVAKGFHHYLKHQLRQDVSWSSTYVGKRLAGLASLPNVTLSSSSVSAFIYYQNVCTWGYTFVWWNWAMWRQHIDWMAMMGVTMTIAPVQEYIWHQVYAEMGLTTDEIEDHLAGPAFQPWQRMGNIRGWGGPLPLAYQRSQLLLQQRLLNAQRALGMTVALPAFAGHLPRAMARLHPNVSFTPVERWNRFPDQYCCDLFVDPNEPLFSDVAGRFLRKAIELYGTNHIYFADPFNEVQPRKAEVSYLNTTAYHIYDSMRKIDPDAVWLLQGWMFVKNIFWSDDLMRAFLTAVPQGQMIVLDLQSEQFPQYERTRSFYGQPFIWCMLHNFGGTLGMHGSAQIVNTRIREAWDMTNSSMIGVGITPEGINQNYVMYSLALERAWQRQDIDLAAWFDRYADVRYGVPGDTALRASWQLLKDSVYSFKGLKRLRGKYTITRRPSFNIDTWTWYNSSMVLEAWQLLLSANASIPDVYYEQYAHDLVDLTRQFLQCTADRLYVNLKMSFKKRKADIFMYLAKYMGEIFADLEDILSTHTAFLLGPWLESAKAMAESELQRDLYEMNARNQITTWGPSGQILDYANKQWSGLMRDYYQPRWQLFVEMAAACLKANATFDQAKFQQRVSTEIELPFSWQKRVYPIRPAEGRTTYQVAFELYEKWSARMQKQEFQHAVQRHVKIIGQATGIDRKSSGNLTN